MKWQQTLIWSVTAPSRDLIKVHVEHQQTLITSQRANNLEHSSITEEIRRNFILGEYFCHTARTADHFDEITAGSEEDSSSSHSHHNLFPENISSIFTLFTEVKESNKELVTNRKSQRRVKPAATRSTVLQTAHPKFPKVSQVTQEMFVFCGTLRFHILT